MQKYFQLFAVQMCLIAVLNATALAQAVDPPPPQDIELTQVPITEVPTPEDSKRTSSFFDRVDDLWNTISKMQSDIAELKRAKSTAPAAPASPVPPSPPAPDDALLNANQSSSEIHAEVHNGDLLDSIPVDPVTDSLPQPILNSDTPDWVKNGLVLGDEHNLAIGSSLFSDLEQCRDDIRSKLMSEVRTYLDKHVLHEVPAHFLSELTPQYVEKYWVKQGQEYDNVQIRPSGTYHQLWIGLHISADQLKKVAEWEKQHLRKQRSIHVGVVGGIGIAAISLLSGGVGLLARREKAKLKA